MVWEISKIHPLCVSYNDVKEYSHVPNKRTGTLIFFDDIDVKMALIGVKTCQNKRICLEKISVPVRLLGT